MRIRRVSIVGLFLVGLQAAALGQDQGPPATTGSDSGTNRSAPAPAVSGIAGIGTSDPNDQGDTTMPAIPSFLGGEASNLSLTTEMERSNYLRAGINVSEGYNDNALLTPNGQEGNTTFSVFPNISLVESSTRIRWSLAYAAGLTVNQRLSSQNQGSHSLNFDANFRLSPHVSLHASEGFSLVAGLFGGANGSNFGTGAGAPGTLVITPVANQRLSTTVVETNYHYAAKSLVGASGSYFDLHYSDVAGTGTLTDTQTASGSGFWLHEIFKGNWAGVRYNFQRITYEPNGKTNVHTFSVTDTYTITKTFHVSGYIGPEYSENQGIAATGGTAGQLSNFNSWGVSGGIEAGWQSARTSVTAGYSKQVSSGSGVLGAVHFQSAQGAVRREIFPGWAVNVLGSYGGNEALTLATTTTASSIKTATVGVTLERNIGRSLGFQAGYFHDFQDQSGSPDPTQNYNVDRNRFLVTLSYQWAKPLGR